MSPDFLRLLRTSLADELRLNGFSELLIRELVNAGIRCNYGQNTNIHAFVGEIAEFHFVTLKNKFVTKYLGKHYFIIIICLCCLPF